jgi:hypothetical protein
MGRETFTRAAYDATRAGVAGDGSYTDRAARQFQASGKLNPLVDPKGYGVIRRSLPRFVKAGDSWQLTVGTPMPVEVRFDTTGSMGTNVQVAFDVLPKLYDLLQIVLKRYDIQVAMGIFGDVVDDIVLCRSQFEMDQKIAEQLTYMVPEGGGGDYPEDPHYGLFAAAYLTAAYINRIGLRGYDFTISDASMHDRLDKDTLIRIFGDEVFERVAENGHVIDRNDLPSLEEMVQDLLTRTHAFFLQVDDRESTTRQWSRVMGHDRVVVLPTVKLLPQVQATIIGLTEGVLDLQSVGEFLRTHGVSAEDARRITRSVASIPIGAQVALPGFDDIPRAGALFREKTDLQPFAYTDVPAVADIDPNPSETGGWL